MQERKGAREEPGMSEVATQGVDPSDAPMGSQAARGGESLRGPDSGNAPGAVAAALGGQRTLSDEDEIDPVEAADALDTLSGRSAGGRLRSVSMSDRPGPWSEFMDEEPSVLEPFPLSSDDDVDEESTTLIVSRTGDVMWITAFVLGLALIGGTLVLVIAR
jgi:hypothetical protein